MTNLSFKFPGCSPFKSKVVVNVALSSRFDLISILGLHHGSHYRTSADHKNEVGMRSGEGRAKVHQGALRAR